MKTLLFFLFLPMITFSQAPNLEWIRVMGGTEGEVIDNLAVTSDGGYIAAGYSTSSTITGTTTPGSADIYIIKLAANGATQWETAIGGSLSENAAGIVQTPDGGYVVGGTTYSEDGDAFTDNPSVDFWLVKLNNSGQILWQHRYGSISGAEEARQMIATPDGGYLLVGLTAYATTDEVPDYHGNYDFYVVKTDANGIMEWQRIYGGSGDDQAYGAAVMADGNFAILGHTASTNGDVTGMHGCYDSWLLKLDTMGNMLWQKTIGTPSCELPHAVKATPDGGLAYAGDKGSNAMIVKTDADGNVQWEQYYGGSGWDSAYAIDVTSDGGYIVTGYMSIPDGVVALAEGTGMTWTFKLDGNGNIKWQKRLGGTGTNEIGFAVKEVAPWQYLVAGNTDSTDGNMVGNSGQLDLFIAKLVMPGLDTANLDFQNIVLYPNPSSNLFTIQLPAGHPAEKCVAIAADGRIISLNVKNGNTVDVSKLTAGLYFIQVESAGKIFSSKIIKE